MFGKYNLANNSAQGLTNLLIKVKDNHADKGMLFHMTIDNLIADSRTGMDQLRSSLQLPTPSSRKVIAKEAIAFLNNNFDLNYSLTKTGTKSGNMFSLDSVDAPTTPVISAVNRTSPSTNAAFSTEDDTTNGNSVIGPDMPITETVDSVPDLNATTQDDDGSTPSDVMNMFPAPLDGSQIVTEAQSDYSMEMTTGQQGANQGMFEEIQDSLQDAPRKDTTGVPTSENYDVGVDDKHHLTANENDNLDTDSSIPHNDSEQSDQKVNEDVPAMMTGPQPSASKTALLKQVLNITQDVEQQHVEHEHDDGFIDIPVRNASTRKSAPSAATSPTFESQNTYGMLSDVGNEDSNEKDEEQDRQPAQMTPALDRKPSGKWYAIRRGRRVGIVRSWQECKGLTQGYSNNEFESFNTEQEAQQYMEEGRIRDALDRAVISSPPRTTARRGIAKPRTLVQDMSPVAHFDAGGGAITRNNDGAFKPDNYMSPASAKPTVMQQVEAGNVAMIHEKPGEHFDPGTIPSGVNILRATPRDIRNMAETTEAPGDDTFDSDDDYKPKEPVIRYEKGGYEKICRLIECGLIDYVNQQDIYWFVWKATQVVNKRKQAIDEINKHVNYMLKHDRDEMRDILHGIGQDVDEQIDKAKSDLREDVLEKKNEITGFMGALKAGLLGTLAQRNKAGEEAFKQLTEEQTIACIAKMNEQQLALETKQQTLMSEAQETQTRLEEAMTDMRRVLDETLNAIRDHSNISNEVRKSVEAMSEKVDQIETDMGGVKEKVTIQHDQIRLQRDHMTMANTRIDGVMEKLDKGRTTSAQRRPQNTDYEHRPDPRVQQLHNAMNEDRREVQPGSTDHHTKDDESNGVSNTQDAQHEADRQQPIRKRRRKKAKQPRVYEEDETSDEEDEWEEYEVEEANTQPTASSSAIPITPTGTATTKGRQEPIQCESKVIIKNETGSPIEVWVIHWELENGDNVYTASNAIGEVFKFYHDQVLSVTPPSARKIGADQNYGYEKSKSSMGTFPMSPAAAAPVDLTLSAKKQRRKEAKDLAKVRLNKKYAVTENTMFQDAARMLQMHEEEEDDRSDDGHYHAHSRGMSHYGSRYKYTEADLAPYQYVYPKQSSRSVASIREGSFIKDAPAIIRQSVDAKTDIPLFYEKLRTTAETYGVRLKSYNELKPGESIFVISKENCMNYEQAQRIMSRCIFSVMSDNKETFFPFSAYMQDIDTTYRACEDNNPNTNTETTSKTTNPGSEVSQNVN